MVKNTKTTTSIKRKKKLQGEVISMKATDTIIVRVERKFAHSLYKKIITKHKKYLVHYKGKDIKVGDKVAIEEGKPMSKRKNFYFVEKLS